MSELQSDAHLDGSEIAVIGMAGRFPGARNIAQFWLNLRAGVESIRRFSQHDLQLLASERTALGNSNHVPAGALLDDVECFDAGFFDCTPKEAEIMDPQHRIFLESAWEAMENAGYYAAGFAGAIGVYAGALPSTYLLNLYSNPGLIESIGTAQVGIGNNVDFLTTMASYKLDLNGPSMTIQTACSTSLVAVHVACQALLNGECDLALAGGVSVRVPQRAGYYYQEGGILSPDGHCRAFDAKAQGTVFGNGVGIVVLRRLADAIADGDNIRAVIKGSAINNDGSLKVGFTAPSVQGQSAVIIEALSNAGVSADTIGYVEAHGTGTTLGDPIEIQALTEAFRVTTDKRGYCPVGSLKTNVGHLDAAAGVAGLIKTILALEHGAIPPSLHCVEPNPRIDFASSPFFVNRMLREWNRSSMPRRAGVSSLGIGGTNAHVVVEDAPPPEPSGPSRNWQLLVLSARTESALEAATATLTAHLKEHPKANLADVAYTLQVGRKPFNHRRAVVCADVDDAIRVLESGNRERLLTASIEPTFRPVVFMFPGQASQHQGMAAELYASEAFFREQVEHCARLLRPHVDFDLVELLFSPDRLENGEAGRVHQTNIAQPALFVIEYALARWLMQVGLEPQAMIGHSIGEYVAACVAGVLSLEDALRLVATRGRLMQALDGGTMLSVQLSAPEARPWLNNDLSLAAVNAPGSCVISGTAVAVGKLEEALKKRKIQCRRLHASHAFHSAMMEPALAPLRAVVRRITLHAPRIPYLSNVTGTWAGAEVTTPEYWVTHLRRTVEFSAGISELQKDPSRILLEVGPGQALCELARSHRAATDGPLAIALMRHARDRRSELAHLLGALAKLWLAGGKIDWRKLYSAERRRRLPLPTYPFERQRFWVAAQPLAARWSDSARRIEKKSQLADWFYLPSWKRSLPPPPPAVNGAHPAATWWILMDAEGIGSRLVRHLEGLGQRCVRILPTGQAAQADEWDFNIDPASPPEWDELLQRLLQSDRKPQHIIHLWNLERGAEERPTGAPQTRFIERGFYSLLHLAQAMAKANLIDPVRLWLICNRLHNVSGNETTAPEKSMALGPCLVIPQEHTNIRCHGIDVELPAPHSPETDVLADVLLAEFFAEAREPAIAYRGESRWLRVYEPVRIGDAPEARPPLREGGVYLIVGGLGRFGLLIARHLAEAYRAKLILTARQLVPARERWDELVANAGDEDQTAWRLRKLMELERLGSEVMVRSLDLTEPHQLRAMLEEAVNRFGALNGVIHAAGIQEHTPLLAATRADCERVFAPKVQGLLCIEAALRGHEIDFCLLTSSLSPLLGGLGFIAYSAANLFLDAFAQHVRSSRGLPWRTINWESWHRRELPAASGAAAIANFGTETAKLVLSDEEVIECFTRALAVRQTPQLIIATGDLQLRTAQWVRLESLREQQPEDPPQAPTPTHSRPRRQSDCIAPRDEIERIIVEVGRGVLGIDEISVHDNFFEMGGSSLLAVQLISRLREAFQQQLPLRALFERPTVAGLAEVIRAGQSAEEHSIEIATLLAEIETLDEEEVQRRLAESSAIAEET